MLDELVYQALGKFKVVQEPLQVMPMRCAGCGRYGSGDPNTPLQFIDMGFELEFHGVVFICVDGCFREIMNQLGVLTKEQTENYRRTLEATELAIKTLKEENKGLHDAVDALNSISGRSGPSVTSVVPVERKKEEPKVSTGSNSQSTGGKERLTKQTNERGSSNLSDLEGDDFLDQI